MMKIELDIRSCKECPFSSGGDVKYPHESWICSKLWDNIGVGDGISDKCPLKKGSK